MSDIEYKVYTALTKPGVGYVVVLLQNDFSYDRNRDIFSFTFLIRYPDKLVLFDATKLIANNIRPDVISSEQLEKESLALANGVVMNHLEGNRDKLGISDHDTIEACDWQQSDLSALSALYFRGDFDDKFKFVYGPS
jgi:hypothetical protein